MINPFTQRDYNTDKEASSSSVSSSVSSFVESSNDSSCSDHESLSSYSASLKDDDDTEVYSRREEGLSFFVSSVRRRGGRNAGSEKRESMLNVEDREHSPSRIKRRSRRSDDIIGCCRLYNERCPSLCNRYCNCILLLSFVVWLNVQAFYNPHVEQIMLSSRDKSYANGVRRRYDKPRIKRRQRQQAGNSSDVTHNFWGDVANAVIPNKKDVEAIQPGCILADWQTTSFPNCNDIHELDLNGLREVLRPEQSRSYDNEPERPRYMYINSGLWRDVWHLTRQSVPGSFEDTVLKTMKLEHDVDSRNLDRHRRDAITMELFTASPNVVSIYGFCANTMLTEYADRGLDKVLAAENSDYDLPHYIPSRTTPLGRLKLALGVVKGVAALHNIPASPIIHADVQTKQFLVDGNGTIKLNDFNRCRFIPHRSDTGEKCDVRIPSAPGTSRSPEEYEFETLDEKLDVYSTGNVLYEILTGENPWNDQGVANTKKLIRRGEKPPIKDSFRQPGTSDAALAVLTELAYERDPTKRISAAALVRELEILVQAEMAKSVTTN
jgi:hypothetical protein